MGWIDRLVKVLFIYACLQTIGIFLLTASNPPHHAAAGMMLTAFFVWVVVLGALMYSCRDVVRAVFRKMPVPYLLFFLFVVVLALLEEAIMVVITRSAPFFGVAVGQAYLTASVDYLDVVLYHSVIVFMPLFFAWTWCLRRYRFHPTMVFLLFGITGLIAEILFAGGNLFPIVACGYWIFTYGLMMWLPAYCLPESGIEPRLYHYLIPFFASAIVLVVFFIVMFLVGTITGYDIFTHPRVHF